MTRCAILAGVLCLALSGCTTWPRSYGTRPCCVTTKPAVKRQSIGWHLFDVTVNSQIKRAFDLTRLSRRLLGVPVRASNLQGGEVPDSAFFTNRDPARLSPEEVRWGPTRPEDIARPPFLITKPKTEGRTPGFFVTDAKGTRYLLKCDPVDAPELLSGAEAVTSKLLYALGYHVPSYEVVVFRPEELQLGPGVMARDRHGHRHPLTETEVRPMVEARVRGGTLRVVASRIVEGDILGPATFKRFRDCAEVRALKVAYAWLNNTDAKDHNSLLVWNGKETVGYLIDFGTSLGADAGTEGPKNPCAGWLNIVDLQEASLKLLTFGLHQPVCEPVARPVSPSVGLFSPRVDPDQWKPYAPNLAFQEMNQDDARWMARRMARLSLDQIQAAVSAGQYSDPADAAYLVDVLEKRRRAIVRYYLHDAHAEGPSL
ncbi:MAG: hypothetical protein HYW10_03760 [Candidatus Omnitrophica bacterium]|nr:hypothetical protein [Candidatus Omnitrophota bacterium]